jgi:hypothetical protein
VTSTVGDITFTSPASNEGYAQIGHGGSATDGNLGDDGTRDGAVSAITVNSAGALAFGGGGGTTWGSSQEYAQIGHGGFQARGDHVGNINIMAADDITFRSGVGYRSYVQIGNGGWDADQGTTTPQDTLAERQGYVGDISVESTDGNISFTSVGLRETYRAGGRRRFKLRNGRKHHVRCFWIDQ